MNNINNKNINSVSSKLRKCSMLLRYIHEKLINNQEIARLVKYNNQNPLGKVGLGYDNEKVDQPDLSGDDVKDLIHIYPFNPNIEADLKSSIFLNLPIASFTSANTLYLDVDILVPIDFFEITSGLRLYEIAHRVADVFDGMYITDKDYIEELGNLKFELNDVEVGRLSSNSKMLLANMRFSISLVPQARIRG